ncbi:hypothetical protein [Morganella morganii]|uniref:hypothetical protein n=1 Tax=Morganella morganii TaxID=582 RepID=UPI0006667722|nr:hypothetical protein [Morganella morganii]
MDNKNKKKFNKQKNRFRGLISVIRSRKFEKADGVDKLTLFRRGVTEHYLEVREALEPSQYEEYINWVNHQIKENLKYFNDKDIGFTDLKGVFTKSPKTTLIKEVQWITARVKAASSDINYFRILADRIDDRFIKGDYDSCVLALDDINKKNGFSLWSIQLRIAFENLRGGLEAQKKYTSEVRSKFRQGLLNFISYHTSVRNEEKTTTQKFKDDIIKRIENHKYFEDYVKTYTKYKLTSEIPLDHSSLSEILWVSQSHSLIDVYETFIEVLQGLITTDLSHELREVLCSAVSNLDNIIDFRLDKIRFHLDAKAGFEPLIRRDTNYLDFLIDERPDNTIRKYIRVASKESESKLDIWAVIYTAVAYACYDGELHYNEKYLLLPRFLGKLLQRKYNSTEAYLFLEKMSTNILGLPIGRGLKNFIKQIKKSKIDQLYQPWIIGLNSQFIGCEDFKDKGYFNRFSAEQNYTYIAYSYLNGFLPENSSNKVALNLFKVINNVSSGKYDTVEENINSLKSDGYINSIGAFTSALEVSYSHHIGNKRKLIEVLSREACKSSCAKTLLPINDAISGMNYDDFSALDYSISSVNCLHFLWLEGYNEERESEVRFSIEMLLKKYECEKPSNLVDIDYNFNKDELVYFLKEVCKPFFMDSLRRVLKGNTEVLSERQEICASLRFIDVRNSSIYADEVMAITNQQAMEEGRWIVDTSRIYVDLDGLNRWANDELSEDYARFRDLLDVNLDIEKHFDALLNDIINDNSFSKNNILSQDESDVVLLDIFSRLSDEFLNNPVFGLDFYLSKRIRHQSFIGLIRGPLEFSHIITMQENDVYQNNTYWISKFSFNDYKSQQEALALFISFSENFDKLLLNAKDRKFHILSKEYPEGLIYLTYNENLFEMMRIVPRIEESDLLDDFLLLAYPLLWDSLEPSLFSARTYIDTVLKDNISRLIDELKYKIQELTISNAEQKEFIATLNSASSEVQLSLEETKNWFKRKNNSELTKKLFALEQVVKIATESALKCQKSFEPVIANDIHDGDVLLTASALVFVHDVLFVALDNARAHSGLQKPRVKIDARIESDHKKLSLKIVTSTDRFSKQSNLKKIQEIKTAINNDSYGSNSKKEGRSGFIKIAAVVKQSNKGSIDFYYDDNSNFVLEVTYSLLVKQVQKEEVEYV